VSNILHLIAQADWEALAPGEVWRPASLATEGFVHCTSGETLMLRVANSFYRKLPGTFLALVIEPTLVAAPIKWEHPPGTDPHAADAFPHIYGPVNTDAVIGTRTFLRTDDGAFLSLGPIATI
jgi:uncharacterized protein (DUF952 family)